MTDTFKNSTMPETGSQSTSEIVAQSPVVSDEKSKTELTSNQPIEILSSPPQFTAFSKNRVRLIISIVTLAGFLGPVSGNIYIPILPQLQRVFDVSATTINATVSVFMAIMAVAPLIWAPYADIGGRKILYLISLSFFILSNILLASLPANIGALYCLRIVQAIGVSSVMSVGAGTVADVTEPKNRAKAISYFMLGPQMGPLLGPILSAMSTNGNWRWIFGFLAIMGGFCYILILFLLPETLRYLVGDGECFSPSVIVRPAWRQRKLIQDNPRYPKPPKPSLKTYWAMLKYIPVLLCSIMAGLLFATFYGMSVTFARVLQEQYSFSQLDSSLAYICPGLSLICGSLSGGHLSDWMRKRLVAKNKYIPESRLSLQLFGIIISMAGILGYGWCVDRHVHVVAVFAFTFLGGFGMTWVFISNTTYLTECSAGQPATYVALGNCMRNVAAAISSAIIDRLIKEMGFGWCFTGFAFVDIICIGCTSCLLLRGSHWRREREQKKCQKV